MTSHSKASGLTSHDCCRPVLPQLALFAAPYSRYATNRIHLQAILLLTLFGKRDRNSAQMTLIRLCLKISPCLLVLVSACSGPTGEYKVALVPARGGQRGFYMVNSDSTGARLISTPGTVQLRSNSWSQDGKKIAYFSVGPGDALI